MSQAHPHVSVIVNCYNSREYLRAALDSVLSQDFTDWELIFWDNQSTDGSAAIFQSIDDERFKYFRAERHTSLGEARNLAVALASGEWLAFLDCDDLWAPDKLSLQLRAAQADPDVGLAYGQWRFEVDEGNKSALALKVALSRRTARPHGPSDIYGALLEGSFIAFSTVLVRRDLYDAVGGINSSLTQNEDYDLLLKIARLSKAVCIAGPCAVYRIHASNNSHRLEEKNYLENRLIFAALPADARIAHALRVNASKHAFFLLRSGRVMAALRTLLSEGSVPWTIRRALARALH